MRAKKVQFQRGADPKDTLDIGNKKLRAFLRDLEEGNYFGSLTPVMELLEEGAIGHDEINEFIIKGIINYASDMGRRITVSWQSDFLEYHNIFWEARDQVLYIIFNSDEISRVNKYITRISKIRSADSQRNAYKVITESHSSSIGRMETGIGESNFFDYKDDYFTLKFVIKQISKVFFHTIENLG